VFSLVDAHARVSCNCLKLPINSCGHSIQHITHYVDILLQTIKYNNDILLKYFCNVPASNENSCTAVKSVHANVRQSVFQERLLILLAVSYTSQLSTQRTWIEPYKQRKVI